MKRIQLLALIALAIALNAAAQSTSFVPGKSLVFKSTFDQYKPYNDEKVTDWKWANDEVGRIGGWRAYLKEASEPVPEMAPKPSVTSPAPSAAPARAVNPHAGHGVK